MRRGNTTFDLYLNGRFPPAAPDAAGLIGCLRDRFALGTEETEFRKKGSARQFTWTTILELPLGPNIPDAYPGAPSSTMIWAPDQNGTPYTVLYVERAREYRGADFLRVYLVKGRTVAIEVKQANGTPDLTDVTTLIVDQTTGLVVSQPAANQAELALTAQMSLALDANGVRLVNDAGSPGNSMYYGTGAGGNKGWFALPAAGMTNPMTTLGDVLYEDGTPTPTRLAGNTTATKKFLRQTGTGAVSAAPAWDTLQISDLPGMGSSSTTPGAFPSWIKITRAYTDFSFAGTSNTIALFTAPAGTIIHACKIKVETLFSGGSISQYAITVGTSGAQNIYMSSYDVHMAAVSGTNYNYAPQGGYSNAAFNTSHTASTGITATANSVGANLNAATQGSVDIWLLVSTAT